MHAQDLNNYKYRLDVTTILLKTKFDISKDHRGVSLLLCNPSHVSIQMLLVYFYS